MRSLDALGRHQGAAQRLQIATGGTTKRWRCYVSSIGKTTKRRLSSACLVGVTVSVFIAALLNFAAPAHAQTAGKKPNILVIMGDDVGWFNIGAYHQGIMSGKTPNLDKLAADGMRFTDYYAEASCTAGRANFITGQIPLRTGLTTVGQAGADVGIPDEAITVATVL